MSNKRICVEHIAETRIFFMRGADPVRVGGVLMPLREARAGDDIEVYDGSAWFDGYRVVEQLTWTVSYQVVGTPSQMSEHIKKLARDNRGDPDFHATVTLAKEPA